VATLVATFSITTIRLLSSSRTLVIIRVSLFRVLIQSCYTKQVLQTLIMRVMPVETSLRTT